LRVARTLQFDGFLFAGVARANWHRWFASPPLDLAATTAHVVTDTPVTQVFDFTLFKGFVLVC
jgi:hypothetical protein